MLPDQPSRTAAWVAAMRSLTPLLPEAARLIHDPYGLSFGEDRSIQLARQLARQPAVGRAVLRLLPPLERNVLWMQVRTRVLDDLVLRFVADGGTQLVLLGAGYDCRGARFSAELQDAVVFEVDHPATQARKRAVMQALHAQEPQVRRILWDFERMPLAELPAHLQLHGLDVKRPSLTLWEGVSTYLSDDAVDATFNAVRAYAAPGSLMAFTYFDRRQMQAGVRVERQLVSLVGEPYRFGWDPAELAGWLQARGFALTRDDDDVTLANSMLPATLARKVARGARHIAVAAR